MWTILIEPKGAITTLEQVSRRDGSVDADIQFLQKVRTIRILFVRLRYALKTEVVNVGTNEAET